VDHYQAGANVLGAIYRHLRRACLDIPGQQADSALEARAAAVLSLLWISVGLWGAYFSFDYEVGPHNPHWVVYPIFLGMLIYLGCAIGLIAYLRGARLFASLFTLLNLYFMLYMFLAAKKSVMNGI
jgi:hypothetical protein